MKNNNKGFTLVELLIAVTLLVVVAITGAMMMSTSSTLWSRTNTKEKLKYSSQVALAQLKEFTAFAKGIYVDGDYDTSSETFTKVREIWLCEELDEEETVAPGETDKIFVTNKYTYVLRFDEDKEIIYLQEFKSTSSDVNSRVPTEQPLLKDVKKFEVKFDSVKEDEKNPESRRKCSYCDIDLKIEISGKTYEETYKVATKSKPPMFGDSAGYEKIVATPDESIDDDAARANQLKKDLIKNFIAKIYQEKTVDTSESSSEETSSDAG